MADEEKAYGVIAEWKNEAALMMESPLMTLDEAYNRMRILVSSPTVIRVAVFRAVYERGNENILPKESKPI